jgi:hypothetical protein
MRRGLFVSCLMLAILATICATLPRPMVVATAQTFPSRIEPTESKLLRPITPEQFGAKCDGHFDDTEAVMKWIDALINYKLGHLSGRCRFTKPIVFPPTDDISIAGDGAYASKLTYAGPDQSTDILSIGNTLGYATGWTLHGFTINSETTMTAGAALHLRRFVHSTLDDVIIDGQDGNGKLNHGAWFDGVDNVHWTRFQARARVDAVRVNGAYDNSTDRVFGPSAGLFLSNFKIMSSGTGIHLGGSFGGIYVDQGDIIANESGLVIDTALTGRSNREVLLGSNLSIDSNNLGGLIIDQRISNAMYVAVRGTWVASNGGPNVWIKNAKGANVHLSGHIYHGRTDGLRIDDETTYVQIEGGDFYQNSGFGINPTVSSSRIFVSQSVLFLQNSKGDFNEANMAWPSLSLAGAVISPSFVGSRFSFDSDTYWQKTNGKAVLNWTDNVYELYDKQTNAWGFFVSGVPALTLSATGAVISVPLRGRGQEPAVTMCGRGPTVIGTDLAGEIREGTRANGCTLNFVQPYDKEPFCVVSAQDEGSRIEYSISTRQIQIKHKDLSNVKINYVCVAR